MLTTTITGLDEARKLLGAHAKQLPFALSRAMNTTVFEVRKDINAAMSSQFEGGATPWTLRAFEVKKADKRNLSAAVQLRADGAGKARSFDETIKHQFTGGGRTDKKSEHLFRAAGILPPGMVMVVPRTTSWANPLDAFGNAKRALIVRLLSYFQAFSEQGYRANMLDKNRKRLAGRGRTAGGFAKINGVVYFVSRGRGMHQPLARGIWAKRGIHGSDVAPVFLFVDRATYQREVDVGAVGRATVARVFQPAFDRELAAAVASAR